MKQLTELEIRNWDEMTNDEKLDRLTTVLTRAGADREFRDRCLRSPESARGAVSEEGGIEFAPGFEVQFLTQQQRLKRLVLAMPEYIEPGPYDPEVRQAEDFQLCSYLAWRS